MCGIAGAVGAWASPDEARQCVGEMLNAQSHRGPDDRGVSRPDEWSALGQVRLAVIDLTAAGHQPMELDGGRLSIVFNGEIYNYLELRAELVAAGRRFISETDTEVILHAFDVWGSSCCSRLNGMWAFAIYDRDRRTLFCSRDRFGEKPLHYAFSRGRFLFSSEIKGLLAADSELAEPDHTYIARFLRTSLVNDDERTFFKNVYALLPGHSMEVRVSAGVAEGTRPIRYWHYDLEHIRASYDFTDTAAVLRELLDDSVRLRLRSDVPVGTCLSGGLDSSSIVALAARRLHKPVRTFSSVYREPGYDEARYIDIVNSAYGTIPYQIESQPSTLMEIMPQIAWHQDEPTAAPGVYSQWHVMQMVAGKATVLLDGQGADEILGGYEPYFVDAVRSLGYQMLRAPGRESIASLFAGWRSAQERMHGHALRQLTLSYMDERSKRMIRRFRPVGHRTEVRADLLELAPGEDPWEITGPFSDRLSNVLYDATFKKSLPALLRYEDRNSMAFSVEARTPFLDYRVVEYSLALPLRDHIDGDWTKAALRRAMEGILPPEVQWRRDKLGYPTPLAVWLRGPFRTEVEEFIHSPEFRSRGVFDMRVVDELWRQHLSGERDASWNVWRWLALEYWFRTFIDGRKLQSRGSAAV